MTGLWLRARSIVAAESDPSPGAKTPSPERYQWPFPCEMILVLRVP